MNRWQLMIAILGCITAGGCAKHQLRVANRDLERENFQLEQRLDQVTWELEDTRAALQACRCGAGAGTQGGPTYAPSSPRYPRLRGPGRSPASDSPGNGGNSGGAGGGDLDVPKVELPDEDLKLPSARARRPRVPPFKGPPLISPPDSEKPEGSARELVAAPPASALPEGVPPGDEAPRYEPRFVSQSAPPVAQSAPVVVTALVINAQLTRWRRVAGDPASDAGIEVVAEPRDAAGKIAQPVGDVAIVVLDPTKDGDEARLARWDFHSDELPRHFHTAPNGGGLRFALKWPDQAPATDELLLFVRLTTPEGEQMVAEYALRPAGAVGAAAAWSDAGGAHVGPEFTAARPKTRWQRATTHIPPQVARRSPAGSMSQVTPREVVEQPADVQEVSGSAEAEPSGPSWAPYR